MGDYDVVFFFKQKTAYEMRISDWSSDVCSSDLLGVAAGVASSSPHPTAASTRTSTAATGRTRFMRGARSRRRPASTAGCGPPPTHGRQIGRASCRERAWQYV